MKYLQTFEGFRKWIENKLRDKKISLLEKIKSKIREYGLMQIDTGGKLILKNYIPSVVIKKIELEYNKIYKPIYHIKRFKRV